MQTEEQELINFTNQWDEAMVRNDVAQIGKFMTDDWKIIGSDGITTRASFLAAIASGSLTHNRMYADELNVSIYGNTGIIVARGTSAGSFNGEHFSMYEWSTNIFLKKEGKWLCVLTTITPAHISR